MKKERFIVLLSTLVALAAAKEISSELRSKLPTSLYAEFGYDIQGSDQAVANVRTAVKYVTKYIGLGGRGEFSMVDSSTKEETGVTNFHGNKMDISNAFIFDRVQILGAWVDNSNATLDDFIGSTFMPQAIPDEIRNAELEIYTDNNKILSIPISYMSSLEYNNWVYELDKPAYLLDGKNFDIKLKIPKEITSTGSGDRRYAVRVILDGIETI